MYYKVNEEILISLIIGDMIAETLDLGESDVNWSYLKEKKHYLEDVTNKDFSLDEAKQFSYLELALNELHSCPHLYSPLPESTEKQKANKRTNQFINQ